MNSLLTRFLAKFAIDPVSGCWNWTAFINEGGYGMITNDRKPRRAHRISYEIHVGPIPNGLDLDHLCRNRRCVNPSHLEPVTRKENLRRSPTACKAGGVTTAALVRARKACPQGHLYSVENTVLTNDGKWRKCKECHRAQERRRYASKQI